MRAEARAHAGALLARTRPLKSLVGDPRARKRFLRRVPALELKPFLHAGALLARTRPLKSLVGDPRARKRFLRRVPALELKPFLHAGALLARTRPLKSLFDLLRGSSFYERTSRAR